MPSTFSGFDNTTLTFQVADGTYTTNAAGNRSLNTTRETIKALLKFSGHSSNNNMLKFFQDHFFKANASDYARKQKYFYPLKHKLLHRFGKPDGCDRQIITKTCWDCGGTGQWNKLNDCTKCDGTGIYYQKTHYLERYILGNRVYHIPVEYPSSMWKNTILGLVKHEYIEPSLAEKSLHILILRYEFMLAVSELLNLLLNKLLDRLVARYYRFYGKKGDWFSWHRPYFQCQGYKKYIFGLASLFAGYIPHHFYEDRFVLIRKERNQIFYHLQWVLEAWERD